jgi:Transcriptional regulators
MEEYQVQAGNEAIEKLENFISVNRLTANTRIPSERDLCEMWGVSRTTLRSAVDTLVEYGLLYRVLGSGVYVAEPKLVRNLVGVTSLNDEIRQKGIHMSTKIVHVGVTEVTKQISRKLKIPLGRKVYEYVRVRAVGYKSCILETLYLECQSFPDFDKHYTERGSMDYLYRNIYHKKQTSGEEHISVTYVSEEEAALLDIRQGDPVFFTSGVVHDETDKPMYYYKSLFRADQFKFVCVIDKQL